MEVSLRADDSGNPASAKLAVLNNPNGYNPSLTGITNFTFSTPLPVDASTKYWVVADYSPGRDDAGGPNWAPTKSTPTTLVSGWVFGPTKTGTPTGTTTWSSKTDAKFIIRVRGTRTLPEVSIAAKSSGSTVPEGSAAVFTVSRTGATTAALTVQLRVAEATGGDMVDSGQEGNKRVVIPIGSASAEYSVTTTGDMEDEPNSSVTVSVRSNSAYNIDSSGDQAAVTITDDDALEPLSVPAPENVSAFLEDGKADFLWDLPRATGGIEPYIYTLTGPNGEDVSVAVPGGDGLIFDPPSGVLIGPVTEEGTTTLTYTVTDSAPSPASVTHTFTITITVTESDDVPDPAPISVVEVDARTYAAGEDIDRALPAATGGVPPYTYSLTGPNGTDLSEAVPGLSFDPTTRVLSGAPTRAGATTLTYTATDSEGNSTSTPFDVTVTGPMFDAAAIAEVEGDYPAGEAVDRTLPEATGGIAPYTYALTGPNGTDLSEVPGLSFDTGTRVLSGTPTRAGTTRLTYTVTDSEDNVTITTFAVTVIGPVFGAEVPDRTWAVDEAIAPLTLPTATGAGPVTYALTGPNGEDVSEAVPGLTFNSTTRVLSGTPTRAGTTTLTYTATDSEATTSITFAVTVTSVIPAALNEALLPEMVRAMAGSTVGAIARRIGQAARGAEATGLSLGGQDGWAALHAHGEAVSEGRRGFEALLSGSGFVLPLNAAAGGAAGASSVALWGSGEYRDLSGKSGTLDWDGELVGVHLGVDARPHEDLLAGVAVSWLSSDLDYEDATAVADGGFGGGIHSVELTSVHPYLGWRVWEGLDVWATAGAGEGELEVTPAGRDRRASDVHVLTVGVGGNGVLLERGVSTVRFKGEVMHSAMEVDDSVHVEGMEVEAMRVRMTVEAGQTHTLADGGVLEPSLEVGVRHDGGDGETGNGAELGGSVSYRHPSGRITAEGRVYALVAGHDGDHEEWGIEGHLGVSPGAGGRGLSLSVRPGYGDSGEGGIGRLWRQGVSEVGDTRAGDEEPRLETRLGYGLFLPGYTGVFTPYTGMTVGAAEGYRIGVSWKAGSRFDLDLVGERRESGGDPAEHALVLRGEVRF